MSSFLRMFSLSVLAAVIAFSGAQTVANIVAPPPPVKLCNTVLCVGITSGPCWVGGTGSPWGTCFCKWHAVPGHPQGGWHYCFYKGP